MKQIINIDINNINLFYTKPHKSKNDKNNKIREQIIFELLNETIDKSFLKDNDLWLNLQIELNEYINNLKPFNCEYFKITHSCGRNSYSDFTIIFYDNNNCEISTTNLEFKCNNIPQFISPTKPSRYILSDLNSYEDYYYDNYLESVCEILNEPIPDKEIYLHQIHSMNPQCMLNHQLKYNKGSHSKDHIDDKKITKQIKDISKRSITAYLEQSTLNIETLNVYFANSQSNKQYMFWKDGKFIEYKITTDDITLEPGDIQLNKQKNSFIVKTKSNKKLKFLLRWKNGNGIAFPTFQVQLLKK